MRADEVPGLFPGPSQSSSVPPLPTIDAPQSIAASPSPKKAPPVKWRWAKIGGVIGLILGVVEILLVRQGKTGETDVNVVIGYMTGFFAGTTLSGAFLGFIAGVLRDYFLSRSLVEPPVAERPVDRQQTPQGNKWNVISKHWRGLYPLWFSYWVINSVGGVFTAVVVILITYLFERNSNYDPLTIFAALISIWVCALAVVIWEVVGVWRSANSYAARRLSIGQKAPWAVIAKIAMSLGVIQLVATLLSSGLPELSEATRMAFMGDPDLPAYSLRIMRNGTEAEITGGIKYGLADDFSKLLKASPQIRVLHLNSMGGRIGEAEKLYNLVREKGLITYVHSECLSACTIVFAGGKERYVAKDAVLGFHEPAFPGISREELQSSVSDQKQIFKDAGFSADFVVRALKTPNSEMWEPTAAELVAAKVITNVSARTQFAASGLGDVTKENLATKLTHALPLLAEIRDRLPQDYDAIVDPFYKSYLAGDTEADAVAAARAKFLPLLNSLKPLADDDVLSDLARVYADEYQALGSKSSRLCYLYASGADTTQNFAAELPDTLTKREMELNERVVHTAARRTPVEAAALKPIWKKVSDLMSIQGITDSQVDLLSADNIPPSKYDDYCTASVNLFNVIGSLPQKDSAAIMRAILTANGHD
jgi:hypothetical protein